jgi:microcin C transport system permease protein
MSAYIARRILLMIPTLLGILFVSFVVVQFAPGGPVERVIAQLSGADTGGTSRISGGSDFAQRAPGQVGAGADAINSKYRGAQGLATSACSSSSRKSCRSRSRSASG